MGAKNSLPIGWIYHDSNIVPPRTIEKDHNICSTAFILKQTVAVWFNGSILSLLDIPLVLYLSQKLAIPSAKISRDVVQSVDAENGFYNVNASVGAHM